MKFVIINGSPGANGNSDLLCNEFIRGAKENGHETIFSLLLQKGDAFKTHLPFMQLIIGCYS